MLGLPRGLGGRCVDSLIHPRGLGARRAASRAPAFFQRVARAWTSICQNPGGAINSIVSLALFAPPMFAAHGPHWPGPGLSRRDKVFSRAPAHWRIGPPRAFSVPLDDLVLSRRAGGIIGPQNAAGSIWRNAAWTWSAPTWAQAPGRRPRRAPGRRSPRVPTPVPT